MATRTYRTQHHLLHAQKWCYRCVRPRLSARPGPAAFGTQRRVHRRFDDSVWSQGIPSRRIGSDEHEVQNSNSQGRKHSHRNFLGPIATIACTYNFAIIPFLYNLLLSYHLHRRETPKHNHVSTEQLIFILVFPLRTRTSLAGEGEGRHVGRPSGRSLLRDD